MKKSILHHLVTLSIIYFIFMVQVRAQVVQIGSGSYTTVFPGTDAAGRNGFPSGTPQLSGAAIGKPVPTNDWWSKLVKEDHAGNLFNYPMTMKTTNAGLVVTYIPWGVIDDQEPIVVGMTGLSTTKTTVSDYSDWTVTMDWNDGNRRMQATSGIAMPFLYFKRMSDHPVQVKVNLGTATISGEMLIIVDARNGADFVFYAPTGSTWTQSGSVFTSDLNDQNYWSMAMLPLDASSVTTVAEEYKKYAYVFPSNTSTQWEYDNATSEVKTVFTVETDIQEGDASQMLIGLLPHQWNNLTADSPVPNRYNYSSVRGQIKTMEGNTFSVANTFRGILPTMPYLANYSEGFSPAEMNDKIAQIENDGLATWTDSYNEGQVMNRLIQTARIADQTGNIIARDKMIATIKERLEDWLTYEASEIAFLFYYNANWSALIGYPAGHGQDNNINDHHFHWGYFIHAAAFMEQFEPGWANQWGDMINHLVRDAASPDRNDPKFPFLRNFSPYAGHCWANGFATFPQGNDQESTSESMQFNSSLIHWGTITGNDEIRDLGIYLYTTEQTAIEEYWFDMYERNFSAQQQYSLVSRVWGNSYDNGTFWTSDITASYGIEMYPIHGGSFYLGQNPDYVEKLWSEIETNTAILSATSTNPNLWHDVFWMYLSFINPTKAIQLYDSYPNRILKFGISDAQTYHWLHAMNAMGTLNSTITADYPIASVFEKEGSKTYVAHNYAASPITVNYSDGFSLNVPAGKMITNREASVTGTLASDFPQAYPGGSVNLTAETAGGTVTKVQFFDGDTFLGEVNAAPLEWKATNLSLGIHSMYAKVYIDESFNVTNIVSIQVGEQTSYLNNENLIPGILQAGLYDQFEGGVGQGITYVDVSRHNEGGFRPEEYVDAANHNTEGAIVGWISAGEWIEYTIDVATAGSYDLSFRYASGNSSGGGPFYLEIDGQRISTDITVGNTNGWDNWASKMVSNIELNKGKQVMRLVFNNGEFNLGKMNFEFKNALSYVAPVADAGSNVLVILPSNSATLDGSNSTVKEGGELTYQWSQIYGPSVIAFSDNAAASTEISNLEEGIYKCQLTVNDGEYTSKSEVLVIVSATGNTIPNVSLTSPANNATFKSGTTIQLAASASDLDGVIEKVEFFTGSTKIGESTSKPYGYAWTNATVGSHILTAKATDNGASSGISQPVNITVSEVKACSQTSKAAQQGTFSTGYRVRFETVGSNVTVQFELLDSDKAGVVAYLWRETPFTETQMDHVSGNIFSKNLGDLPLGSNIRYGCKFAFAGGLAVTQYFSYQVGSSCIEDTDKDGIEDQLDECPNTPLGETVNEQGCSASQLPLSANHSKVNDNHFYPNPVSTTLHWLIKGNSGLIIYPVIDINGKQYDVPVQIEEEQLVFDFSNLKKGLYFISVEQDKKQRQIKILKN